MSSDLERELTISNRLGLHARAAATLVKVTSGFASNVTLEKNGHAVNGKSILGMMTLAAGQGSVIVVRVSGPDAGAALDAIVECINGRFGEE